MRKPINDQLVFSQFTEGITLSKFEIADDLFEAGYDATYNNVEKALKRLFNAKKLKRTWVVVTYRYSLPVTYKK